MIVYDVADAGDAQNHFPKCFKVNATFEKRF